MKKIMFNDKYELTEAVKLTIAILSLLAMTLTGCEPKEQTQIEADVESHITEISYKGHKYLYFHKYDGMRHAVAGITHDPDCPCHNKLD